MLGGPLTRDRSSSCPYPSSMSRLSPESMCASLLGPIVQKRLRGLGVATAAAAAAGTSSAPAIGRCLLLLLLLGELGAGGVGMDGRGA